MFTTTSRKSVCMHAPHLQTHKHLDPHIVLHAHPTPQKPTNPTHLKPARLQQNCAHADTQYAHTYTRTSNTYTTNRQLTAFSKSSDHAFTQRHASAPADIHTSAPDHLAYATESQVLNSVLRGTAHPQYAPKSKLDTPWSKHIHTRTYT